MGMFDRFRKPADAPVEDETPSLEDRFADLSVQAELAETPEDCAQIAKALVELTGEKLAAADDVVKAVKEAAGFDPDNEDEDDADDTGEGGGEDAEHAEPDADNEGGPSDGDEDNQPKAKGKKKPLTGGGGGPQTDAQGAPAPDGAGIAKALDELPGAVDARPLIAEVINELANVHLANQELVDIVKALQADVADLRGEAGDIAKALQTNSTTQGEIVKALEAYGSRGIGTPRGRVVAPDVAVINKGLNDENPSIDAGGYGDEAPQYTRGEIIKALHTHIENGNAAKHDTGVSVDTINRVHRLKGDELARVTEVVTKELSGAYNEKTA